MGETSAPAPSADEIRRVAYAEALRLRRMADDAYTRLEAVTRDPFALEAIEDPERRASLAATFRDVLMDARAITADLGVALHALEVLEAAPTNEAVRRALVGSFGLHGGQGMN